MEAPEIRYAKRRGDDVAGIGVRTYRSDTARNQALDRWLHTYNHHRAHTALGGQPPMSRLNNLPDQYN